MLKAWIALAGVGALLTACANTPPKSNIALAPAAGAMTGCADHGGCGSNAPPHRQYYDERASRYYYYDAASGGYHWEDGTPRP